MATILPYGLLTSMLIWLVVGPVDAGTTGPSDKSNQVWDYVNVRSDAYMFWWLYYTTASEGYESKPLVMWLQGGPGASSTGYGNFMELGPLDTDLKPRTTTWLSEANLLFVDNPVGTGYSYVTNENAYARTNKDIAVDLVTTMKAFLKKIPNFQKVPFYVFSESYGGKMAAGFAQELYNAIKNGDLKCNFKGFAMGDSWIAPLSSVLTWGPYMYTNSIIDKQGLTKVQKAANICVDETKKGNWSGATIGWGRLESIVEEVSNSVNFYNILKWGSDEQDKKSQSILLDPVITHEAIKTLYHKHVGVHMKQNLDGLMNGAIRKKLKIIPKNVTWGGQSANVFQALNEDFMKSVVSTVDDMLKTPVKVIVYNGQLDLIVDTLGTEDWVEKLLWDHLKNFFNATRKPFYTDPPKIDMAGFVKSYDNFSFYWVLNAGHMIPADAGRSAIKMLKMIVNS